MHHPITLLLISNENYFVFMKLFLHLYGITAAFPAISLQALFG